ncbi:MAG: GNAT family N-acetyltransferase [Burkholderiaceae bacterium]
MAISVSLQRPEPEELCALLLALGWGEHSASELRTSICAFTATVCARDEANNLIGYASVFSDRCLTTMLGELLVHPSYQRRGIGKSIMELIEASFPAAPVYIKALGESRQFYEAIGFQTSLIPVTSMFKKPWLASQPASQGVAPTEQSEA